jgi:hypothetical protein
MHSILICAFLLISVAPLWGRWRVRVWLKENMPNEKMVSDSSDLDVRDDSTEFHKVSSENLIAGSRDRI